MTTATKPVRRGAVPIIRQRVDPNTDEENWRTKARCRGHSRPDLWFPVNENESDLGIWLCHHCPVMMRCRAYAIANKEEAGTWGAENQWTRQKKYGIQRSR